jgi:hypothetical protein
MMTSRGDDIMKNPVKLRARIEKRWVLSVNGVDIPMKFKKSNEMAGMVLLSSDVAGNQMVVDVPDNFASIMSDVLGVGDDFEVKVVKASSAAAKSVKKAFAEAARIAEEREDGEEGGAEKKADKPAAETEPEQEHMEPIEAPEEEKSDG